MAKVTILLYSGYGHTKHQAQGVIAGVEEAGGDVSLLEIDKDGNLPDGGWDTLKASQAIIFGSPTYMGGPAWQFKKIADASSKVWFELGWKDKLAGGFTNSASMNGDKNITIHYFMTLAMQHGMIWAGTGLPPANQKASQRDDLNWLGGFAGALATSPADASAEEAPAKGDIETAKAFGKRIAELAGKF